MALAVGKTGDSIAAQFRTWIQPLVQEGTDLNEVPLTQELPDDLPATSGNEAKLAELVRRNNHYIQSQRW